MTFRRTPAFSRRLDLRGRKKGLSLWGRKVNGAVSGFGFKVRRRRQNSAILGEGFLAGVRLPIALQKVPKRCKNAVRSQPGRETAPFKMGEFAGFIFNRMQLILKSGVPCESARKELVRSLSLLQKPSPPAHSAERGRKKSPVLGAGARHTKTVSYEVERIEDS